MRAKTHPYLDFGFKCNQDWSKMADLGENKYCSVCEKSIIDFTTMSNTDVLHYLNQNQKVCGKMSDTQLNELNTRLGRQTPIFSLKSILFGTALMIGQSAVGQENNILLHESEFLKVELVENHINPDSAICNIIRGTIVGSNGFPISYAKIYIPELKIGKVTDDDGKFEFLYDVAMNGHFEIHAFNYNTDTTINVHDFEDKEIRIVLKEANFDLTSIGYMVMAPTGIQKVKHKTRTFFRFNWLRKNKSH